MSVILMDWASVWILDGSGLSPGLGLMYVGIRDLICDILS